MSTCTTRLLSQEAVAEGTSAFHFEKPGGFVFKPGQAIDLILPGLAGSDPQAARHAFSLVSAPFEDRLTIATRMRDSAFKRALGGLAVGEAVEIDGPFGSLTLHRDVARPAVFIAGGIGITPFVSMLRHAAQEHLARRFVLVYSNRRPEDAAFLEELRGLARRIEGFKLMATMTRAVESQWAGRRGPVDAELLKEVIADLSSPACYVAGPPAMVADMRRQLNQAGIDDEDIRSEDFFGY
ncbi:MAG: ferredoxin--NADP reductase [Ignavibacteria bacterium]